MSWFADSGALLVALVAAIVGPVLLRRSSRDDNKTADWSAFAAEQREWTEDRLAERDKRIESLSLEVEALRNRFDMLESKYRSAVAYIRRLVAQLRSHVPNDAIEKPPSDISPDL